MGAHRKPASEQAARKLASVFYVPADWPVIYVFPMSSKSDYDKRKDAHIYGAPISWVPKNDEERRADELWGPRRNDLRTPQPRQQSYDKPIPPVSLPPPDRRSSRPVYVSQPEWEKYVTSEPEWEKYPQKFSQALPTVGKHTGLGKLANFFYYLIFMAVFSILILALLGLLMWWMRSVYGEWHAR
jgi:hypothetical protein